MKRIIFLLSILSSFLMAQSLSDGMQLVSITVLIIIITSWLTTSVFIVHQKTAKIIETLGKFSSVRTAGIQFKLPYPFSTVASTINLQILELSDTIGCRTSDESFLKLPIATQYQVINSEAGMKNSYYELDDATSQMSSYISNIARNSVNDLTIKELYSAKGSLEKSIKAELSEKFEKFGFKIINVLIEDPILSEELVRASNRVLAAEKEKYAATNEAEALKVKLVGQAQAEKESLVLKAEAFTEYRLETSKGNKEAMNLMTGRSILDENGAIIPNPNFKSVEFTEKDILNFFVSIDTNEAIRTASKNQGTTVIVSTPAQDSESFNISMIEALKNK